jgi:tetratricopeptide (TPR) repeat protein
VLAGNPEAAARVLRESCDELGALGEKSFRSTSAAMLAGVLDGLGRSDEAEEFARLSEELASPDDVSSQALIRMARAMVLARRGGYEEALALAREAVDLLAGTDFVQASASAKAVLAEVLFRSGEQDEAERWFAEAKAILAEKGNVAELELIEQGRAELLARSSP